MKWIAAFGCAIVGMIAAVLLFAAVFIAVLFHAGMMVVAADSDGGAIQVEIDHADRPPTLKRLPALDGATVADSGGWQISSPGYSSHFHSDENFKVARTGSGHFTVSLHRTVENNGAQVITDTVLPVWDQKPAAAKWVKLPDGSSAVAYLRRP